jgi:hypothetical protein
MLRVRRSLLARPVAGEERAMALRVAVLSLTPKGGCVGEALETLGYKCYNLHTCFGPQRGRTDPPKWTPYLLGRAHLDLNLLKDHDAVCGLPASGAPERLLAELPKFTKVILVVETDKDRWVKAYQETVPPLIEISGKLGQRSRLTRSWHNLIAAMYPTMDDRGKPLDPRAVLERFEDVVKTRVPPHRLLVYHPGDGWEPLLHFLDRDPTPPDEPFPQTDYGETSIAQLIVRMKNAYYYSTVFIALAASFGVLFCGPIIYGTITKGHLTEGSMARAKAIAGGRIEQHVLPILDHVGPSVATQGRQAMRTMGIPLTKEEEAAALLEGRISPGEEQKQA